MASVIAIVRLAPGRVGYFDDITRIHLTIQSPEKPVIEGMDVSNLKRAVKGGSIRVVSGSLDPVTTLAQEPIIEAAKAPEAVEIKINQPAEVITAQINRVAEVPVVSEPEKVVEPVKEEESAEVVEPVKEEALKEADAAEEVVAPVEETEAVAEEVVAAPKKTRKKK